MKAQAMLEYLIDLSILIALATSLVLVFYPILFPPTQSLQNYIYCKEIENMIGSVSINKSIGTIEFPDNFTVNISNGLILVSTNNYKGLCKADITTANESGNANAFSAYYKNGIAHLIYLKLTDYASISPAIVSWSYFPGNVSVYLNNSISSHYLGKFPANYTLNLENYLKNTGTYYLTVENNSYIKIKIIIIDS
ncbi:MAG: hypothetical protein OH318_02060 [Candidatus Parvarchaeota archaeon]|nr:hypothetical protein [Candidatus Rehaiarchaeum fermentans]